MARSWFSTLVIVLVRLLVLVTFAGAEQIDFDREASESKLPGCFDKGGAVFDSSYCGPYLSKAFVGKSAEDQEDLVCCVPFDGIKFMSGHDDECTRYGGYLVGDGPLTLIKQCKDGDRVVGIMKHYASGAYYCCTRRRSDNKAMNPTADGEATVEIR